MPGALSLPAHAILALNHGMLDGPELQRKAKLVSNGAQRTDHAGIEIAIVVHDGSLTPDSL